MNIILDCYTDEASGLGVPPYLGVHPRYLAGSLKNPIYLTIDDLRFYHFYKNKAKRLKETSKSNIKIYNLTKNSKNIASILKKAKNIYVILGCHVPGKYLSALPGTLYEVRSLLKDFKGNKIITGPAFFGTRLEGGKKSEKTLLADFHYFDMKKSYSEIDKLAIKGASIFTQIPSLRMIEIETSRGCQHSGCSFCLEPIKNKLEFRSLTSIVKEIKTFYSLGARYFRLGKQSCIYSYPKLEELFKAIWHNCPDIKVLHIDNANPKNVTEAKTKILVKYCTPGNIAALGAESFDLDVVKANNLNSTPEMILKAIKIINKYGSEIGSNGSRKLLPGINLLFGLKDESVKTFEENYKFLKKVLDSDLLLRRINIRHVAIFEQTPLSKVGNKFLKKNKKYYHNEAKKIRTEIDHEMLKKVFPKGLILKYVYTEVYDGNITFCRQFGTYPIIIGVKERLPLNKFINIKVKGYMLRSLMGEKV